MPTDDLARRMEELYRQYRSPMFRVALAVLRDEGLAEDAVQQAFLKIFRNFSKIDWADCNKTRSFIVILVRNTAIDLYRRRKRENVISFEELERPLPDWEEPVDERVISSLEGETAARLLAGLDEKHRNLLILRYYHGYRNKEIAELLGMTQAQVALGLHRGKERLRRKLEGDRQRAEDDPQPDGAGAPPEKGRLKGGDDSEK